MKLLDIIPDLDKICSEHINPLKFIKRRFIDQCFRADIAMVGHIGNNRFQILLLQRSKVIIRKELRQFYFILFLKIRHCPKFCVNGNRIQL